MSGLFPITRPTGAPLLAAGSSPVRLSPGNPVQSLLQLESDLVSPAELRLAQVRLHSLLKDTTEILPAKCLDPDTVLYGVHELLEAKDFEMISEDEKEAGVESCHLFIKNLCSRRIDCDDIGFIYMALAHELQWPLTLGHLENHITVLWQEASSLLVFDFGELFPESYYEREIKRHRLNPLTAEQIEGLFNLNRALTLYHAQTPDYNAALEAINRAIEHYAFHLPIAYFNRGSILLQLEQREAALNDFDRVLVQEPQNDEALYNRGLIHYEAGDYQTAIADFAAIVDQGADAHCYLSSAFALLGDKENAAFHREMAMELDPQLTRDLLERD